MRNQSASSELKKKIKPWILVPGIFCLLPFINACLVGPNYLRPKVKVPEEFKEAPKGWKKAEPNDAVDRGEWWKIFKDPKLNTLEREVMISNQNIAVAEAQYRQARALVDESLSALYPTLSANASITRSKSSSNASSSAGTSSSSSSTTGSTSASGLSSSPATLNSLSLVAAWEPDLWGGVRRAVESSRASFQASAAELAAVRLSTQGLLAQSYYQLCALDADQKLLDETVLGYQKSLKLVKDLYQSGVAARLDIIQAEIQLQNAKVLLADNGVSRAQLEHAIAVLIGKPPAEFSLASRPLKIRAPKIPLKIPSSLLERRPDVAVAELQAAAANAQIGVAMSAFYPGLTLSATGGYASTNFSQWITQPARFWSLGPQLTELIFDGGKRSAVEEAAYASFDQSVANYRQTVLSAFQNVEDNLVAYRILGTEAEIQRQIVANTEQALNITINQYKAGTVAYSSVVTAQIADFSAKKSAIDIDGRRMVAAVGIILALGGGWEGLNANAKADANTNTKSKCN